MGWSPYTGDSVIFTTKPIEPNQPAKPVVVNTFTTTSSMGVEWSAPMTNGAPIIEYQLDMQQLSVDLSYLALGGYNSIGGNFGAEDAAVARKTWPWVTVSCQNTLKFCKTGLRLALNFSFVCVAAILSDGPCGVILPKL